MKSALFRVRRGNVGIQSKSVVPEKTVKRVKSYLYLRSVLMCSQRKYFQACRAVLAGLSLRGDPSSLIVLYTLGDHAAPDGLPGPAAREHLKPEKPSDQPAIWYRYQFVYVSILIPPLRDIA